MNEVFVEIGTEELPARFVEPALAGLAQGMMKLLSGLEHGEVRTWGTPRRLAVAVSRVAPARPVVDRLVTGPPAARGWADGRPSPVGEAFAKGKGVDPATLFLHDTPKGQVVAARVIEGGERTADIVAAGLDAVVQAIPFARTMRWGSGSYRFGRPLHRVCCVVGGEPVETTVMGVFTVGTSVGHWLHHPEPFAVTSADQWVAELRHRLVYVDVEERRERISVALRSAAAAIGLVPDHDEALLHEVTHLVEAPAVVTGTFPEELLELPARLLVESMKVNQRYFALFEADGRLANRFLVVTNNPHGDVRLIAQGNARVLTARFYDARFFYAEDRKRTLAEHGAALAGVAWIRGLGTMAWRQEQIGRAAAGLAGAFGADPAVVGRAAVLLKNDLCTQMVGEFPELQGHVGRLLAQADGEPGAVALAIEEAWFPRFAGDQLPTTPEGRTLAVADRLVLLGLAFADEKLGLIPRGSADPQGIRRAAGGLVALLLDAGWEGELTTLFQAAGFGMNGQIDDDALRVLPDAAVVEFVLARFRALMVGDGHAADVVDAVLAVGGSAIVPMARRIQAISARVRDGEFEPVRTTFRRVAGLAREHRSTAVDPALFTAEVEHALLAAIEAHLGPDAAPVDLLDAIVALRPSVDAFFDGVLVMADDAALRSNRLGLLRSILDRVSAYADFSRLSSDAGGSAP